MIEPLYAIGIFVVLGFFAFLYILIFDRKERKVFEWHDMRHVIEKDICRELNHEKPKVIRYGHEFYRDYILKNGDKITQTSSKIEKETDSEIITEDYTIKINDISYIEDYIVAPGKIIFKDNETIPVAIIVKGEFDFRNNIKRGLLKVKIGDEYAFYRVRLKGNNYEVDYIGREERYDIFEEND